jgi:hypothetical protein
MGCFGGEYMKVDEKKGETIQILKKRNIKRNRS